MVAALVLSIGLWPTPALALDDGAVGVEVRVWQDANNARLLYISARPASGSWSPLGTVRLTLDDEGSSESRRRYRSVTVQAPFPGTGSSGGRATVEIRVEQGVDDRARFFVIARGEGQFWSTAETAPLFARVR